MRNLIYNFDNFSLNPQQRKLFSFGQTLAMSPRTFEMLLMLIERQGEVIKKEEFLETIWSDSFVEESNLTVHISALRRVLQEKRGDKKFIETISGRGYCFVAPVSKIEQSLQTKTPDSNPSAGLRKNGNVSDNDVSIAVLPLKNLNCKPDLQYLVNGITESLIDNLAQIPKLKVMAYNAVKNYDNADRDLQETGFLLGVEKLLIGSVTEFQDKLEIRIELLNAADQLHIWGTHYEFSLEDYFKVRDEISLTIAKKLKLKLKKLDEKNGGGRADPNSEAHKAYLKGKHLLEAFASRTDRRECLNSALKFFREALQKDSSYAEAYVGMGSVYFFLFNNGFMATAETNKKCRRVLKEALKYDDCLSEAFVLKGMLEMFFDRNLKEAAKSLQKAIKLNPNNAYAYHMGSLQLMFSQHFEESVLYQNRAIELDPASTTFNCGLINRFFFTKEYDKAIVQAKATLELNLYSSAAYLLMALSYAQLGNYQKAFENLKKSLKIHSSDEAVLVQSYINALAGNTDLAKKILNKSLTKLNSRHKSGEQQHLTTIAAVYAALGEDEKCFEFLQKDVLETKDVIIFLLRCDPRFDHLHSNPKFIALLKCIKN
jgi:DNA-binding winged helix-turn-helix (wHTH) protein/lipopolysaccharide biosynthesis regulator YciM